jgi:osmotically-inducible protein OsmY
MRYGNQSQRDDWRSSGYSQEDDWRHGGSQRDQGRWGSPVQRDDWRSGSQVQGEQGRWGGYGETDYNRAGGYQRGATQGYGTTRGAPSYGMGGTYEGEFGPEPGSAAYSATGTDWGHSENWLMPGPMSGRGPEGYQRADDRIKEDICERLTQHGQLDASGLRVMVEQGEVTLEGTVDSRGAKRMAEDAVESVPGVRDVHNHLRLQQGDSHSQGTKSGKQGESLPKGQASMTGAGEQSKSGKRTGTTNQDNGQTTMGSATTQSQKSGASQTGGVTGKSDTGGRTSQSGNARTMKNE